MERHHLVLVPLTRLHVCQHSRAKETVKCPERGARREAGRVRAGGRYHRLEGRIRNDRAGVSLRGAPPFFSMPLHARSTKTRGLEGSASICPEHLPGLRPEARGTGTGIRATPLNRREGTARTGDAAGDPPSRLGLRPPSRRLLRRERGPKPRPCSPPRACRPPP